MPRASAVAVTCLACGLAALVPAASGPERAGRRAFRMGFTPFPYDISLQAVEDTRRFLRENGDIVAQHIEGVPWAEALDGTPFHKTMMDDWQGRKATTPPGVKVYLAVSPGRGELAAYRGASEGLPVPPAFQGKAFDDPVVKKAYLAYCRRAVEFFKPSYLAIGIEVNEIHQFSPARWRAYLDLHRAVYQDIKRDHPSLPVFASFTLHGLLNLKGKARDEALAAFQELMPWSDILGVSFYPFIAGGTTDIRGSLGWLFEHFDRFRKPYAIAETGEAAERLVFPKTGQVVDGSAAKQAAYYKTLLAEAQARRFRFVISFLYRDYDALWEKIKGTSPEVFLAWRDCGLVNEAGAPRPAHEHWKRYLAMPLEKP